MTDIDIQRATGISVSTFHRWKRGDFNTTPEVGKIVQFCDGLGVPAGVALRPLGVEDERDDPAPDPPIPPDIRRIMRGLVDPAVSDSDKSFVREVLKTLATRVSVSGGK
ncbi:hypothetical protein Aco04nite_82430 [Winogradskya consettensis]|uniref:Uncharacterized protein n=2 Tax=Winogradskya consettensis TaxID=113560 RepID=A0A919VZU3_9ACTN|nr:hypothetical protein Aco04nite_82430 [Actinoplanes consettensis]